MKNNKAAGTDKIIPELLKGFDDYLFDVIEILVNLIFEKGVFPEEWTLGVITFYSRMAKLMISIITEELLFLVCQKKSWWVS